MAALFIMKHFALSADETACWLRLCRSASLPGPQKEWLHHVQRKMWNEGEEFRLRNAEGLSRLGREELPHPKPTWWRNAKGGCRPPAMLPEEAEEIARLQQVCGGPLTPAATVGFPLLVSRDIAQS